MQTALQKDRSESGSILFLTLILAVMLGITLGSYLYWVRTQNLLVTESQAWNSALAIAEAGIEEGMAQINVNVGTATPLKYIPSIVSSNWGSGPLYSATNQLGYLVTISNDSPPTIYSSGTTVVPLVGKPITRTVMVKTATNSLFGVALAAIQNITMNGNNVYLDAYDSADLVHFPGGLYNSTNAFAGADVASDGGILSVGNANVHGRLILAPGASYSLGPNGLVGDMPANWPAQYQVETPTDKWVITDFNKEFPDVVAPFSTSVGPTQGTGTNQWVLSGGNFYVSGDMQVNNNKVLSVVSGVNNLYVTGNFSALQNSLIQISPGATLKLYIGQAGGTAVSASFGQVNNGGNAFNFQVFGLPTCTAVTLGGNGQYVGTMYMPEAALSFNGGGSVTKTLDFQGGIVIYSANLNGHFNVHYDVNLSRTGFPSGYTVAYWRELPPPE